MYSDDDLRISLIGDIFPGELIYTVGFGIRSRFLKHKGNEWEDDFKEILGKNDLIIGNLESPLVEGNLVQKKTFFGEPAFALFLKKCGINVLNVANNHILEHGVPGFQSTISALNNAGICLTGNLMNSKPHIIYKNIKNFKVAIAGFSNVDLNKLDNYGSFAVLNEENVLEALNEMKRLGADLKILCLHWGNEYIHVPSLDQIRLAHKFIDCGANVIAGHHPHVIQPYEAFKGGHIFYSLGNFIFDHIHSKMVSIGFFVTLTLSVNNKINVRLQGIKLSFKKIVRIIPTSEFDMFYLSISQAYEKTRDLSEKEYETRYNSLLRKNHLKQRILIKTSLVREFLQLDLKDKLKMIRNFASHLHKIIKIKLLQK